MIKTADILNFGILPNASYEFAEGLNVIMGEGNTGKTQLLKLMHSIKLAQRRTFGLPLEVAQAEATAILMGVFQPSYIGRLINRDRRITDDCEVCVELAEKAGFFDFRLSLTDDTSVKVERAELVERGGNTVYLAPQLNLHQRHAAAAPMHDLMTNFSVQLWGPTVGKLVNGLDPIARSIQAAAGGRLETDRNQKASVREGDLSTEISMVGEGQSRLLILDRMLRNLSIAPGSTLFWDTPESGLNPKQLKLVALWLLQLVEKGIQIFIATHSLFLLRELEMAADLDEFEGQSQRYLALVTADDGVKLQQSDSFEQLTTIACLDEELGQSDRFMAR